MNCYFAKFQNDQKFVPGTLEIPAATGVVHLKGEHGELVVEINNAEIDVAGERMSFTGYVRVGDEKSKSYQMETWECVFTKAQVRHEEARSQ